VLLGPERPHHVPTGVDWVGLVTDRGRLRHYFETSTLFVMPSHVEPFGLVFLEAMVFGLPCIGSRRDAMPEIITDGVTGFLVEPGDEAGLAARLLLLLEDHQLAARLGEAGRARVLGHYLWSDVALRMHHELQQLAATEP
jgi:glycosyltransferase involved in cell wall biosynthesis